MNMRSIENDRFIMALFALGALIYWVLRRFRLKIRPRPVKTIDITLKNLRWYICVSSDLCIVLWDGCIDFGIPVRRRERSWKSGGKTGSPFNIRNSQLIFAARGGEKLICRSQLTPMLQAWIRNHGGCLI